MILCRKCGRELGETADFCDNCGTPVRDTGSDVTPANNLSLKDDNSLPEKTNQTNNPGIKPSKSANMTETKKIELPLIIALCVVVVVFITGGIIAVVKFFGTKPSHVDYPDIRKYFEENGEIKEVIPVNKSKKTFSEKDVVSELESRGFNDYAVTTSYSIKGTYNTSTEVSNDSSKKHPVYETYYVTDDNKVWLLTVIEGTITATPITYNMDHGDKVTVLVSESEEIVSYDNSTNSFYRTIPKPTVLNVRVVDRIDAHTLQSLNLEG